MDSQNKDALFVRGRPHYMNKNKSLGGYLNLKVYQNPQENI
jgi:hypothetical protein